MKRSQAIEAYTALLNVKLNNMSEGMTDAVLADILSLSMVYEQFCKVRDELRYRTIDVIERKRLEEYDKLTVKVQALSGQNKAAMQAVINDNYADVIKAHTTWAKAVNRWLEKDVVVEIETIDRKEFIKIMKESEQAITPANLDVLSILFHDYRHSAAVIDTDEIESLIDNL